MTEAPWTTAHLVDDVRAITIRQPQAWAVFHGKDVENRVRWLGPYTGGVLIHAAAARVDDWDDAVAEVARLSGRPVAEVAAGACVLGAVIGVARIPDYLTAPCWSHSSEACRRRGWPDRVPHPDGPYTCSPWARGPATGHGPMNHIRLEDRRPIAVPVPARGALGLWRPAPDLVAAVFGQRPAVQPDDLVKVGGAW